MSTVSRASRSAIAASLSAVLRAEIASVTVFFSGIDARAAGLALLRAHRTERLQQFRDRSLLAERAGRAPHSIAPSSAAASISASKVRSNVSSSLILSCLDAVRLSFDTFGARIAPRAEQEKPAQPCQAGFPNNFRNGLGKRWLNGQRFPNSFAVRLP